MTQGLLNLLAPDIADHQRLEQAIGLVRRLANGEQEASEGAAGSLDLDVARAELEYETEVRRVALELCGQLFRFHLVSLTRTPESPRGSGLEAWSVPPATARSTPSARSTWLALLELEGRGLELALPSLPEPGEPAGLVAARLVAAATCLGLDPGEQLLWRAHLATAEFGPKTGAAAYRKVLEVEELEFEQREAAHLGMLGCLLTAGAVARAKDWAETHMDVAAASPRLMRLLGWIQLAAGDEAAADEFLSPIPRAGLPAPIVALGDRRAQLRERLVGSSGWDLRAAAAATSWTGLRRSDVGAAVLCVVQLEAGRPQVSHAELAPGIGSLSEPWLERQDVAPFEEGEPEWQVLLEGKSFVGFPNSEGDAAERRLARGCLSPRCRGLALVPLYELRDDARNDARDDISDETSDVCAGPGAELQRGLIGWLRLEFEHLLVPEDARLVRLAAAVGRRLGLGVARPLVAADRCPRAGELFRAALAAVAWGRRRWWGVSMLGGRLEVLATEGAVFADWEEQAGTSRWIEACLYAEQPFFQGVQIEIGKGLHRAARSGFGLPLGVPGTSNRFALLVESTRAGDLGVRQAREWMAGCVRDLGAQLEAAAFDAAHKRDYAEELRFPWRAASPLPESLSATGPAENGLASACAPWASLGHLGSGPVLVSGPSGSGKGTLGRLRGYLEGNKPLELRARGLCREELATLLDAEAATLRDVDELSEPLQLGLLRAIEAGRADHVTLTSRREPEELGLWAPLREALRARALRLSSLEHRRNELPGLFAVGLRRAARRQGCVAPHLTEGAEALIWRQTWSGGLHELFDLARRVVPLSHGRELDERELLRLARSLGWQLLEKLPTRGPSLRDLWLALESRRKKCGSFHRGRAAGLLGWDPDTLATRLSELGLT